MKDSTFYLPVTVLAPLAQLPLRARALPGHLLLAAVRPVSGGDCPSPCASGSSAPPAKGGSLERTGAGTAPPRPGVPGVLAHSSLLVRRPPRRSPLLAQHHCPPAERALGQHHVSTCTWLLLRWRQHCPSPPAQAPLPAPFQQLRSSSYQCTQQSLGRRVGAAHCGPLSEQNHSHALVGQAGSL